MVRRQILLLTLCATLTGCAVGEYVNAFFTQTTDPVTGEVIRPAPVESLSGILGLFGPLGVAGGILLRSVVRNKKATRAVFDSVKTAIDRKDLSVATSPEAIKLALKTAQDLHEDSKLIAEEYRAWKASRAKKGL